MKMRALVVGDEVINRPARGEFPASMVRELLLVDQDDTPLQSMTKLAIAPEDPVAPASKGAQLNGQVVTVAITKIAQSEYSKEISFKGKLVKVEGIMEFRAAKAA